MGSIRRSLVLWRGVRCARLLWLIAVCPACSAIADAQYDDRVAELEANRSEIKLGNGERVEFIQALGSKLYWAHRKDPNDVPTLYARDPKTGADVQFQLTEDSIDDFATNYAYSDQLVVLCNFDIATAYSAQTGAQLQKLPTGSGATNTCAADGNSVYFINGSGDTQQLLKWTPGGQMPAPLPTPVVNLNQAGIGTSTPSFSVEGTTIVLEEGGTLWQVDLAAMPTPTATWLENDRDPAFAVAGGLVVFDQTGVIFDTSKGVHYLRFDDHVLHSFDEMIANGGYELNSKYADIDDIADDGNYLLYKHYILYRGKSGTFAYDLTTNKVTDLLLDRADRSLIYRGATVTTDGFLFAQHRDTSFGSPNDARPVFQMDLKQRLP